MNSLKNQVLQTAKNKWHLTSQKTDVYNFGANGPVPPLSTTAGEIQMTFGHTSIGNKYLDKTVIAFAFAGSPVSPTVVSLNDEHAFACTGDKILPPITEVLLCAAISNLERSKKLCKWVPINNILLPPLLTKAAILNEQTSAVELLKLFASKMEKHRKDIADDATESGGNNLDSDDDKEVDEKKKNTEDVANQETGDISMDCDDIPSFPQTAVTKGPSAAAAPLLLRANNHVI